MTPEFAKYHGIALRTIIVQSQRSLRIEKAATFGRVNSFVVNNAVLVHLKHSSKRLPPWQFTFTEEQVLELRQSKSTLAALWLVLICGMDGLVELKETELDGLIGSTPATSSFVRVDRVRRGMYWIHGSLSGLNEARANGIQGLVENLYSFSDGLA